MGLKVKAKHPERVRPVNPENHASYLRKQFTGSCCATMQATLEQLEAPLSAIVERQENVAATLCELDTLLEEHRSVLPPRLVHFLERRSYQKALTFVREGDQGHHA